MDCSFCTCVSMPLEVALQRRNWLGVATNALALFSLIAHSLTAPFVVIFS